MDLVQIEKKKLAIPRLVRLRSASRSNRLKHAHVRADVRYIEKNMVARARLHFPAKQPVEQGKPMCKGELCVGENR